MCYSFYINQTQEKIEASYGLPFENGLDWVNPAYYNGFTFPSTPVILAEAAEIRDLHWGLIPSWAKNQEIRKYTLNARIETLSEKPSFKGSVKKRALIIASGFYEWQWLDPKGNKKQKFQIHHPDDEPISFGGLWSSWTDKESGEVRDTYTIVTMPANALMSEIHNTKKRMPLILDSDLQKLWLQGEATEVFLQVNPDLEADKIES